jgi:hypothetical protein
MIPNAIRADVSDRLFLKVKSNSYNIMKVKLRQFFLPLVVLLMAVLVSSCGQQTERENRLLRADNETLKEENQRLQREIEVLKAAMNSAPMNEIPPSTPSSPQSLQSPRATHALTAAPNSAPQKYWLTISTNKRHNSSCRYFEKSTGRYCGPNEGTPCKICGG